MGHVAFAKMYAAAFERGMTEWYRRQAILSRIALTLLPNSPCILGCEE